MTSSFPSTHKWLRFALWTVAAVLVLWIVAWLAVPPLVKSQLPRIASEQLGRKVTLGAVDFKPWSLELTLKELSVATADGDAAQLSVARTYLNASIMSLLRLAPVVDALTVNDPRLLVTRLADGGWDIDDVVAKLNDPKQPDDPASGPPKFALRDVLLSGGAVKFTDRVAERTHALRDLTVALPFISSLESERQVVVQPRMSFTLNGVGFETRADSTPFSDTGQTDATLKFAGLDIAPYLAYLPPGLPAEPKAGQLDASLQIGVVLKPEPGLKIAGSASLSNVDVAGAQGQPLLALDRVRLEMASVRPLEQEVHLAHLVIESPRVALKRGEDGALNLALGEAPKPQESNQETASHTRAAGEGPRKSSDANDSKASWKLALDQLAVTSGQLAWLDRHVKPTATAHLRDLRVTASGLAFPSVQPAQFSGSALIGSSVPRGEDVALTAPLPPASSEKETPLAFSGQASERGASLQVMLDALPFSLARPYFAQFIKPDFSGHLTFDGALEWTAAATGAAMQTTVRAKRLVVGSVALEDGSDKLASVQQIALTDASLRLADRALEIGKLQIVDPTATIVRREEGRWGAQDWLRTAQTDRAATASEAGMATKPPEASGSAPAPAPWSIQLAELSLAGGAVSFVDETAPEPLKVDLSQIRFGLTNATLDSGDPGPIRFKQPAQINGSARIGNAATAGPSGAPSAAEREPNFRFSGSATERSATVDVDLTSLPLALAQPYIAQTLKPRLTGNVTLDGAIEWKAAAPATDGVMQATLRADRLAFDGVALLEGSQKLAGIGQFEITAASIGLPQWAVNVGKVRVVEPMAQVSRGRDGRWMAEEWLRDSGRTTGSHGGAKQDAAGQTASKNWSLNLAALSLEGGDVSFVDNAAELPLALDLSKLQLELKEAALKAGDPGPVRFSKPAQFSGSLLVNPAAPQRADATARNSTSAAKVKFSGTATERVATVNVDLAAVPLSIAEPYYAKLLKPALGGTVALNGALEWKAASGAEKDAAISARADRLVLDGLALRDGSEELARIGRLEVRGAKADLGAQDVRIERVQIVDPKATLLRNADGRWMYQQWLNSAGPSQAMPKSARGESAVASEESASPWSLRLAQLALSGGDLDFVDKAAPKPVSLALSNIDLQMQDLSSDGSQAVPLQLSAQLEAKSGANGNPSGRFDWRGKVAWNPRLDLAGTVAASGVPVQVFEPYFGQSLNIDLTRARAGFEGDVAFAQTERSPTVSARGTATVGDLQANAIGAAAGPPGSSSASAHGPAELLTFRNLEVRGLAFSMAPGEQTRVATEQTVLTDFFARLILYPSGQLNLQSLLKQQGGATQDLAAQQEQAGAAQPSASGPEVASGPATVLDIGPTTFDNGRLHFTDLLIKPNYSARLRQLNGELGAFTSRLPAAGKPDLARLEIHGQTAQGASLEITGELNPVAKPLALAIEGKVRDLELPPFSPYSIKYAGHGIKRGKLRMDVDYRIQPDGKLTASNEFVLRQLQFGDKAASATKSLPVKLAVSLLADRDGVIDLNIPISGSLDNPQFSIEDVLAKATGNLLTKAVTAPFSLIAGAISGGPSAEALNSAPFPPGSAELALASKQRLDEVVKALGFRPELDLTITGTASPNAERDAWLRRQSASTQATRSADQSGNAGSPSAPPGAAQASADAMRELALQRAIAVRDYLAQSGLPKARLFLGEPKLIEADRLSDRVKDGIAFDTVSVDEDKAGGKGADTDASGGYIPHVKMDLTRK